LCCSVSGKLTRLTCGLFGAVDAEITAELWPE
jgi:hypothetical protein